MMPSSARADLAMMAPWEVCMMASIKGIWEAWMDWAEARLPVRIAWIRAAFWLAAMLPVTLTTPVAPEASVSRR